jgi:hypothetical protein
MNLRRTVLLALAFCAPAFALQPADVQIKADPAVTVQVSPRAGNTSKTIGVTVNKQDRVTVNGKQVYPVVPPPPPFSKVADEGGAFTIAAPAGQGYTVRYGAGSTWIARDLAAGSYTCDNATFTDPIVGTVKHCEQSSAAVPVPVPPPPNVTPPPTSHMHSGVQGIDKTNVIVASADGLGFQLGTDQLLLSPGGVLGAAADPSNWEQDGAIRTFCKPSHVNNDDALVHPGEPGVAHDHTFFRPGTDSTLTDANVRAPGSRSTCRGGTLDLTARWMPSMYEKTTMRTIVPHGLLMYYKTGLCTYSITCSGSADLTAAALLDIHWLPPGLHLLAGDPAATAPTGVVQFACMMSSGNARVSGDTIPACLVGEALWVQVHLPNCLALNADGSPMVDSADHRSHAAYMEAWPTWTSPTPGKAYRCPLDHPFEIPQIDAKEIFEVLPGMDTTQWGLSCGPDYCAHVDWFNGWDFSVMDPTSTECLRKRRDCGSFQIFDGRTALEFQGN